MDANSGDKTLIKLKKQPIYKKKAIRLMTFSHYLANSSPLFKKLNLLKLNDIITLQNIIFTHNTLNNKSPAIFKNYFKKKTITHNHMTINNLNSKYSQPRGSLKIPKVNTS